MPGQYIVKQGNVLEPELLYNEENIEEQIIIPHVVNNLGVMGAGVALALKNKWPEVEEEYLALKDIRGLDLGEICWANVGKRTIVVNMIAQDGLRSNENTRPLKYSALIDCMRHVYYRISYLLGVSNTKRVIHAPKFGSELAGGKWEFIEELIKEIWIDNNVDVVIYELKR